MRMVVIIGRNGRITVHSPGLAGLNEFTYVSTAFNALELVTRFHVRNPCEFSRGFASDGFNRYCCRVRFEPSSYPRAVAFLSTAIWIVPQQPYTAEGTKNRPPAGDECPDNPDAMSDWREKLRYEC